MAHSLVIWQCWILKAVRSVGAGDRTRHGNPSPCDTPIVSYTYNQPAIVSYASVLLTQTEVYVPFRYRAYTQVANSVCSPCSLGSRLCLSLVDPD